MRLASRMDHHVPLEGVLLCERLTTFGADYLIAFFVLRQQVLIQIFLRNHTSFTDVTFIFRLVMRPFLMHVQRAGIQAYFVAHIALDRFLFVVKSYMVR